MIYDVIVIGGGPGGIAAGIYATRKQMKTLFLTESFGGQSTVSAGIENWIGTVSIPGWEFAQSLEKHLRAQEGIEIVVGAKASGIAEHNGHYIVSATNDVSYETKSIILATGGRHRHLDIPGEEQFVGKGVVFCSTCDAPFFRNKKTVVVGGGNSGLEAVEDLLPYSSDITLMVRSDVLKGDAITQEKILASEKVKVIYNALPQEILGETKLEGLRYLDKLHDTLIDLPTDGVFVEIGMVPNTEFVKGLVELNERGEIMIDHRTKSTSRVGIFATGDATDAPYKQNNISAGDGVVAALSAYDYIRHQVK
ncbi:MAG: Pyr redox 2 protein [Patescibacteria group bacterium]|jgi:alkyl hydroperoxide reductase subunit F|nr:Pyr redox 2 protein [Patescibacteria group bacterium]